MHARTTTTGVDLDVCEACGAVWFDRGEILFYAANRAAVARAITEARAQDADAGNLVDGSFGDDARFTLDRISGGLHVPGPVLARLQEPSVEHPGALTIQWQPEARQEPLKFRVPKLFLRTVATVVGLYTLLFGLLFTVLVDVPWLQTLGLTAAVLALGLVGGPSALDMLMRWLYTAKQMPLSHLPTHLAAFIERVCAEHGMRPPRVFVIPDGTPTAMTYGITPSTARLVFSEGLVAVLEPRELEAVIGHELGHARSWDMAVATLAQLPPQALTYAARWLKDQGSEDGYKTRLAALVRIAAEASDLVVLWLSRTREYHADRFGALAVGSPNAMARALIKVAYGLAARPANPSKPAAADVRTLGIFDTKAASTLALTTRKAPTALGPNDFNPADVQGAMKWDLWNPWARVSELMSTHPLVAKRLLHLATVSEEVGETPLIAFDLKRPQSYWGAFAVDAVVQYASLGALALIPLFGDAYGYLGGSVGMLLLAVTQASYLFVRYRAPAFAEMSVATLLRQVKVSEIRGIPCRLEGFVRGRGVAGLIYSDDLVMHDATGMIFLDHRQPLAIWEFLWGLLSSHKVLGTDIVVEGWYRRAPVPYVEIARTWVDGKLRRSWYRMFRWCLVGLLVVLGGGGVVLSALGLGPS